MPKINIDGEDFYYNYVDSDNPIRGDRNSMHYSYTETVKTGSSVGERFHIFSAVVRIVLILVFGFPVIQFLFTGDVTIFNLETILSMLENAPLIDMSWLSSVTHYADIPQIVGDWLFLDGLREAMNYIINFLNILLDSVIFLGWIGAGVLNGVIFITYFVSISVGGV